jgi:hypothetical protein
MKPRRIWTYLATGGLLLAAVALQGCFETVPAGPAYGYGTPAYGYGTPAYGYGTPDYGYNPPVIYPGRPVYGAPVPRVYGDYDDAHHWHDRDWWMNNRRPWVEQHHREWLTARPNPHDVYGHHEDHDRD